MKRTSKKSETEEISWPKVQRSNNEILRISVNITAIKIDTSELWTKRAKTYRDSAKTVLAEEGRIDACRAGGTGNQPVHDVSSILFLRL